MKKKELLQMRRLMATSKMIKIAKEDVPQNTKSNDYYSKSYQAPRKYQLYLRCQVENGILKAALYYPDSLRSEGRLPSYMVYIDGEARRFVTYDCINNKWLEAKVDRLDWPHYLPCWPSTWISDRDSKMVGQYLGSEKTGYDAILEYQMRLRLEERYKRYQKETAK